ncbi:MAG: insulinase family protein [Planctomycetes bacterium]|nr:insulinase family protein [Planctomycetota bacterium]
MSQPATHRPVLDVPHREFVLENGLRVLVHEDRSDPVVAVQVAYHVGSAREERGRSGLAHLFEHLMFEGSEHVAAGEHFKRIQGAGGTLNGTTTFDRTWYFETLPVQHLELALWLEADRMGGLVPALTQAKLDNQRDVVKNERRQSYENRPYGRVREVLHAELYPDGHPYSWIPIGSMADLDAATLDDVKGFFRRWYGPNNAVLAIVGDVDTDRALALAEKHFGPIPRGPEVGSPPRIGVRLGTDRRAVLEDRVQLPQLSLLWPTVPHGARETAALELAAMLLSQNKSAVLDRALTVDRLLARSVSISAESYEIAGQFLVSVVAAPRVSLDEIEETVRRLIAEVAGRGVDRAQVERMKHRARADHVWRFETAAGKASELARAAIVPGDPSDATRALERLVAVDAEDVEAVLRRFLAERPAVVLSTVPGERRELASNARSVRRVERSDVRPASAPEPAPRPSLHLPSFWSRADGALKLTGTRYDELPLSAFHLALAAGRVRESHAELGLASLCAALLGEGTRSLSTTDFTDRLDFLGANFRTFVTPDELVYSFSVLDEHRPAGIELLAEALFAPRFDPADFERLKSQTLIAIDTRGDQIRTIAQNVWVRLIFGESSALGFPGLGTRATIERLTLDDVRRFHAQALARSARLVLAASEGQDELEALLAPVSHGLAARRDPAADAFREPTFPRAERRAFYLVDKPGAAQSELRLGHLGVAATDPDYYPLQVLNYAFGGAFTSRLNQNLREHKGFTYGAHATFEGERRAGAFTVATAVHTDVTAPALVECLREIEAIREGLREEELELAKQAHSQSLLRQFESLAARVGLADNVSRFGWAADYPLERLAWLDRATTAELGDLARRRIRPDELVVLVVGDAARIGASLDDLGAFTRLDLDGDPIAS